MQDTLLNARETETNMKKLTPPGSVYSSGKNRKYLRNVNAM